MFAFVCFLFTGFGGQTSNQAQQGGGATVRYTAMFQFDASRDDELSVVPGDVINVLFSIQLNFIKSIHGNKQSF
jgi:hypothetical protein